jgi:hypothetical protein
MGSQAGVPAQIRFQVVPDKDYQLRATEDCQSWATIWNASPVTVSQWLEFKASDTTASGFGSYRLVVH